MGIDVAPILDSIVGGAAGGTAVALAWGVGYWAIRMAHFAAQTPGERWWNTSHDWDDADTWDRDRGYIKPRKD